MAAPDLSGYVEVHERVEAFYARYPEGSLQGQLHGIEEVGEARFLVYVAKAYRTPDDPRPGMGWSWEPVPGKTTFTRDSELENAETSAWGRALAALGFEVNRSIASREEVTARQNGESSKGKSPTQPQLDYLLGKGNRKGLIEKAPLSDEARVGFIAWATKGLTFEAASKLIETLKEDPDKGAALAANISGFTDIPGDTDGLPTVDEALADTKANDEDQVPF